MPTEDLPQTPAGQWGRREPAAGLRLEVLLPGVQNSLPSLHCQVTAQPLRTRTNAPVLTEPG